MILAVLIHISNIVNRFEYTSAHYICKYYIGLLGCKVNKHM